MVSATVQRHLLLAPSRRARFARDIAGICGASNVRLLHMPAVGDVLTSVDLSPSKRVITHSASIANRTTPQGSGLLVSYNGTSQNSAMPDSDDMSPGNGTGDLPLSIVVLANTTDTAAERVLFAKYYTGGAGGEYYFTITAGDALALILRDHSAAVNPLRTSNGAVTQGVPKLFGATYSAATGGATAANDIALYQDGAVIASTATNQATYVAMENLAMQPEIGARSLNGVSWFAGSLGMVLVCFAALTANQMLAIKAKVNEFYGLAL
jgi:hypothetical protein